MPKVLITTSSFQAALCPDLDRLLKRGYSIQLNPYRRKLTEDEVSSLLDDEVVGIIAGVEPLTRKVLFGAKSLRVVSRCGIGLDSVDTAAAGERGILVYNTPDAPTGAVAELTTGLMLALLRDIPLADREIRAGRWKAIMGGLLGARTVGIVGFGRIGQRVAELVRGFGSSVLAHDLQSTKVPGIRFCDLDTLLREADVVTLHVPYGPDTRHILNADRISRMKRGAILVNTSRGGLVDEDALCDALKAGHLSGASLDTFESEPYRGPLVGMDQVVLTAHMGSYAAETRAQMEREAAANLLAGLARLGLAA